MQKILDFFNYEFMFGTDIVLTPKSILIIIAVFFLTYLFLRIFRRIVFKTLNDDAKLKFRGILTFFNYLVYLIVILITLDNVGVKVSTIFAASAASGTIADAAFAVGITTVSGNTGATVPVVTDEVATVDSQNITHQNTLTPGRYYYLSNVPGQVTLTEPSGISFSGGFQASTLVGMALTQSDIHLEIDGPVFLST